MVTHSITPKCPTCGTQHRIGSLHSAGYYLLVSGNAVVLHPSDPLVDEIKKAQRVVLTDTYADGEFRQTTPEEDMAKGLLIIVTDAPSETVTQAAARSSTPHQPPSRIEEIQ